MKTLLYVPAFLLTIYSATLIAIEWRTSQDHVRHYFTDIEGPVRLYAINTTLSAGLLWACALLFAIQLLMLERASGRARQRAFCASQILLFAYLGFDDRFLIHETLSDKLGVHDALLLLVIGLAEIACLMLWGELRSRSRKTLLYLGLAAITFLIMAGIDAFLPSAMVLRLSFEDLFKTWCAFFLFLFAWQVLQQRIREIASGASDHLPGALPR